MYKWPNRCSQLRYRASAIPTTGTLAPIQDYSAYHKDKLLGISLQLFELTDAVNSKLAFTIGCSDFDLFKKNKIVN